MIARLTEDARFSAIFDKLKDRHPIGRFGEPSEIGEAVKWLLSDAASFMNGAAMACDGGYLSILAEVNRVQTEPNGSRQRTRQIIPLAATTSGMAY